MSLAATTLVTMLDGSRKQINNVQIGDRLLGKDGIVRIIDIVSEEVDAMAHLVLENGYEMYASYLQPVLSEEGYVQVKHITPQETAAVYIDDTSKVRRVSSVPGKRAVYQLKTEDSRTYYANGIIVGDIETERNIK